MPLGAFPDSTESDGYPDTHSSVAPLLLYPDSGLCRTPFRASSDTLPILSDTIPMVPENCPTSARNTVRHESERCPAEIGTLSDRNWNQCPTAPGIRSESCPSIAALREYEAALNPAPCNRHCIPDCHRPRAPCNSGPPTWRSFMACPPRRSTKPSSATRINSRLISCSD